MHTKEEFDEKFFKDPSKFGYCTFDEFQKNKDKWIMPREDVYNWLDKGAHSPNIKSVTNKIIYFVYGYKCESLERAQSVIRSMGLNEKRLAYNVVSLRVNAGKYDHHVHFMSKDDHDRRSQWK